MRPVPHQASADHVGAAASIAAGPGPAPAAGVPSTVIAGIDIDRATIPQLRLAMQQGRLTAVDLVQCYLHRIDMLNPRLHAVISVSPTALDDARTADQARKDGDPRPLLGIPVLLKDNIDTAALPTTAGSLALTGHHPVGDAVIVANLKAAGAIVLGKANLSEWANFRSHDSSSGWSAVGGQTNNPYALDRNPCGSSSGPAVAAAASLAAVAVGTETDGSIVCPAGVNGVVGIKPTLGLVSQTGIVPISHEQDAAGPIARNVTDAAVLLAALARPGRAAAGRTAAAPEPTGYPGFLDRHALRGARIGVWRQGNFGVSSATDVVMEAALERLPALGATVVEDTNIPYLTDVYGAEVTALSCEFKHHINDYLATRPGISARTLADLIAFNDAHAATELQWFGQDIFLTAQATSGDLSDPVHLVARETATRQARTGIRETLVTHRLDAILAPTNSPPWPTDLVNGDHHMLGSSTPAAVSGFPSITVPAGYVHGLPVGMSLIGDAWSEPKLIALAYAWEQATQLRVPPTFPPSIPREGLGTDPGER